LTCKLKCNQGSEAISIQDVGSIEIRLEFSSQNLCHPKDLSERCFAKTIFSSWQLNGKDVESGRQEIFPERKLRSSATGMRKAKKATPSVRTYPGTKDPWRDVGAHRSLLDRRAAGRG
jgi:hypothetical protein